MRDFDKDYDDFVHSTTPDYWDKIVAKLDAVEQTSNNEEISGKVIRMEDYNKKNETPKERKRFNWGRGVAIAACLIVVGGALTVMTMWRFVGEMGKTGGKTLDDAAYSGVADSADGGFDIDPFGGVENAAPAEEAPSGAKTEKPDTGYASEVVEPGAMTGEAREAEAEGDVATDVGGDDWTIDWDDPIISDDPDEPWIEEPFAPEPVEPQAGMLTAAEWNDNRNFEFFQNVLARDEWQDMQNTWRIRPTNRVVVTVIDPDTDEPVKGANVAIAGDDVLAKAVTDYSGKAYLYYNLSGRGTDVPTKVYVQKGTEKATCALKSGESSVSIDLHDKVTSQQNSKSLDLMFVVDTTGSMGDELEYLKTEMMDVIRSVSKTNDGINIRLSVNYYRDEGDEYVLKAGAFSDDIEAVVKDMAKQYSAGGGDEPEAVDAAFVNAINEHEWRKDSVKIMFFVLDAPPHSDRQGTPENMRSCMEKAASMGIRVIPIFCSGQNRETEYLMRTAAAVTGGTYTFLTNDSGIGNSHLEPTIGEYQVERLNAMIIRLINKYCQ